MLGAAHAYIYIYICMRHSVPEYNDRLYSNINNKISLYVGTEWLYTGEMVVTRTENYYSVTTVVVQQFGVRRGFWVLLLRIRGAILNRTCGAHKNLYILLSLLTIFGSDHRCWRSCCTLSEGKGNNNNTKVFLWRCLLRHRHRGACVSRVMGCFG